jgi:hypothetical protein
MKRIATYSVIGLLLALMTPPVAVAQPAAPPPSPQELRRQLEQLQAQMAAQTQLMNELRTRINDLEQAKNAMSAAADQQATPPPQPSRHVSPGTGSYEMFAQDHVAAPRVDNAPLDPKYPGFFRLPGTQTFLKIGGYFKTDVLYDGKPAGDGERFIPSSFPAGLPAVNNTTVSVRPTRMNLDFRVPVASLGDVRFFVEADLFGSSSTTPRLRHAYTQGRNLLVGQTFSNFQNPDAGPDQLDFQGPNSQISIRNPQIRYTAKLGEKTSLAVAVEKPSSDVAFKTPEFNALPNSPSPDGTLKLRHETEGGNIQLSALFRSVAAYLPNGASDTVFGWGLSLSGSQKVVGKDTFVYQGAYGAGMQRYINDTSGLGIDAAVVSVQEPHLRALPMVGAYFAYQHWWASRVRSSVIYGFAQVNNTNYQPGSVFHKSNNVASNLIWNVFGTLNVGSEFLYGWVVKKDSGTVNAPRIMFSAKYDLNFAKKD